VTDNSKTKEQRVEEENRVFQEEWTEKWYLAENNGKQGVSVPKEYSLRRQSETKTFRFQP
jgi:hypothetical protein